MIREILVWPHPVLAAVAKPVVHFDADLKRLLNDMVETMEFTRGAGLAAPQMGFPIRAVVLKVRDEKTGDFFAMKLINPVIVESMGMQRRREGCLSLPGYFEEVKRAQHVRVEAQDEDGNKLELHGDGVLAQALQHEIEHLDGRVFVQHLSPLKQAMARKKFEKAKKQGLRYRGISPEPRDFTSLAGVSSDGAAQQAQE